MSKTLDEMRDERNALNAKVWAAEQKERDEKHAAILGKTFKYSNSGGHDGKRWWLYAKVTKAGGGLIEMFEFQTMPDGEIHVRPRYKSMFLLDGFNEIPKREYDAAWRKVTKAINGF